MGFKTVYICDKCGEIYAKWAGKCAACGAWNSLIEDVIEETKGKKNNVEKNKARNAWLNTDSTATYLTHIEASDTQERLKTNIKELDRLLGGGIVKGSVVLIGGEPGSGKSTLLLQVCKSLKNEELIHYYTGEESKNQIKLRAIRLNVEGSNTKIIADNRTEFICDLIKKEKPSFVIIDSIQTLVCEDIPSGAGSISQVKESTTKLLTIAKDMNIPIFIIGHVNKDGAIAGPKVLEHIVDTVLYFEGDKTLPFRVLRAIKNRFGSTNEIAMFDMTSKGLEEVINPSEAMLKGRPNNTSGNSITCIIEGTRPILAEIQVLINNTMFGMPRRTSVGYDHNRVNLLYAVLEKRLGYDLSQKDSYINIVGGLKISETCCDLPILLSTISSVIDKPIPDDMIIVGEIGLGGEVRSVSNIEIRIKEAEKIGFKTIIVPEQNINDIDKGFNIEIIPVKNIREAFNKIFKDKTNK